MSDVPNIENIDPYALETCLIRAGFSVAGRREGLYVRMRWPNSNRAKLVIPLDKSRADWDDLMSGALRELRYFALAGFHASGVLDAVWSQFHAGWPPVRQTVAEQSEG